VSKLLEGNPRNEFERSWQELLELGLSLLLKVNALKTSEQSRSIQTIGGAWEQAFARKSPETAVI